MEGVEDLRSIVDDFDLFEEHFFSNFFEEGGADLEMKILIWRMSIVLRNLKIGRFTSKWKYLQLFSKHVIIEFRLLN